MQSFGRGNCVSPDHLRTGRISASRFENQYSGPGQREPFCNHCSRNSGSDDYDIEIISHFDVAVGPFSEA